MTEIGFVIANMVVHKGMVVAIGHNVQPSMMCKSVSGMLYLVASHNTYNIVDDAFSDEMFN